jgi:hypothetical protein
MNLKKIIQEEVNDFDWMEKIDNLSYDYLNGKALEFDPPIGFDGSDEGDYFNHVLKVLNDIGFTTPNSLIDLLEDPDDELTGLLLYNGKMTWTGNIFDDYEYHINYYAEDSGIPTPIVIFNGRNLIHLT